MATNTYKIGRFPGFPAIAWLCMICLYLPIFILVAFSFNANRAVTIWSGFSLDWYLRAASNEGLRQAATNSLIVAVVATLVATAMATGIALATSRGKSFRGATAILAIVSMPMMIPEIVIAVGTLSFFVIAGIKLGLGNVIIAHCVFCIPFAYLPIRARLEVMDPRLDEAATDLYASSWSTFRLVTLPLLTPGVLSGAMLAFIISLDDYIITAMVGGAGTNTLPVYVYTMLRLGVTPEINAISTVLLGVSIIFVSGSYLLGRSGKTLG
ncbi:MAG: ABC transporter permease [Proteobacteria bacterium]|nr:MAG: ABC transporter permease [Pseudomonadota bacterium]